MTKQAIATEAAPRAVGAYCQAVKANGLVFLSGQIPLDPVTGAMIEGDVSAQTRRVMDNLGAVLLAAGSSFDQVVKAGIFLVDINDFAAVNEVYASYFTGTVKPARATVAVSALPRGAKVEVDMIALAP